MYSLAGGISAYFFFNITTIVVTSFLGSYLFNRGISIYAGHFPSETTVLNSAMHKQNSPIDPKFYFYFVSIILMTAGSCMLQRYFYLQMPEELKNPFKPQEETV